MENNPFAKALVWWLICGLAVSCAVWVSLVWIDVPLARAMLPHIRTASSLGRGLGAVVLVSGELAVMLVLVAIRLTRGALPPFGKAMVVAISASLIAYAANDVVLKMVFGMSNPWEMLVHGADHRFHFFQGDRYSTFPSGHMALAGGFAFALIRLDSRAVLPMITGLSLAAVLLILGDWHFLSDVLAGTVVGATAGLAAGEVWAQHTRTIAVS